MKLQIYRFTETEWVIVDIQFDVEIPEHIFSKAALRKQLWEQELFRRLWIGWRKLKNS
jgi:hypothetical protein